MAASVQIVIDSRSPSQLAAFWAEALGYIVQPPPEGFDSWEAFLTEIGVPESEWDSASAVVDPEGKGPRLYFQKVPETKTIKNRVHLDVGATGGPGTPLEERRLQATNESERLVAHGAAVMRVVEERDEFWIVMQDPEGNEFCVH